MTEPVHRSGATEVHRVSRRMFLGQSAVAAAGALAPTLASPQSLERWLNTGATHEPLDPSKKIRLGVVGGGFGANFFWHLDPNCIVQAVSDLREDRRRKLQEVYRCKTSYRSLEELLEDRSIDAVAIFTGAPDHVPHTEMAMKAGKHVISAVPACTSLEQAERLKGIVTQTGLTYMLAETSWFQPESIAAAELYKAGAFGDLFLTEMEYSHPTPASDREKYWYHNGERTWRYGYAPMLYPTHALSFLISTTGERYADVSCLGLMAPGGIEGYVGGKNAYNNPYNAMMGLFSTDKGNVCRANIIWTGTNHGERATWFGTKLSLFMPGHTSGQPFHGQLEDKSAGLEIPNYLQRLPEPLRLSSDHGGSHPFLCHEFIASLVERRRPAIGLEEGLAMTVPGIIACESARRGGERLKIPSFA